MTWEPWGMTSSGHAVMRGTKFRRVVFRVYDVDEHAKNFAECSIQASLEDEVTDDLLSFMAQSLEDSGRGQQA